MIARLFSSSAYFTIAIWLALSSGPAHAMDRPIRGGPGGIEFRAACGAGRYLRGVSIRSGAWVDAILPLCAVDSAPHGNFAKWKRGSRHGGTGGSPLLRDAACPPDQFVIGLKFGLTGDKKYIDWVAVQCIPIKGGHSSDICLHTGGGCPTTGMVWQMCPNISGDELWATGIHGRSSNYVNALGLICGSKPGYLTKAKPIPSASCKAGEEWFPQTGKCVRPIQRLGKKNGKPRTIEEQQADCESKGGTYDKEMEFCLGVSHAGRPKVIIDVYQARCKKYGATWDPMKAMCVRDASSKPSPQAPTVRVRQETSLYDAPNGNATGAILRKDTPGVTLVAREAPWYHVKWSGGQGWVYSNDAPGDHHSLELPPG